MKTIDRFRQKDRRQKRAHSVSSFCFVVFRPQSLLDILESRVMKRMSINHCADVAAYNYEEVSREQLISVISPFPALKPQIRLAMRVGFFYAHTKKILLIKVKNLFCSSKFFMVYYIYHITHFKGEKS